MEKLLQVANASEMVRLVRMAGFDWILDGRLGRKSPGKDCMERAVLLAPTNAAFAQLNTSWYEQSEERLHSLIAQHILLVKTCGKSRSSRELELPLPLEDQAVHASLLDKTQGGSSPYGALAFRRVSEPEEGDLGFVVGVKGARGTTGVKHSARVLEFGNTHSTDDHASYSAGILTLNTVLEPYKPIWLFRWSWVSFVALLVIMAICAGGAYGYLRMRSRGYRRIPDALEGEEE